MIPCSASPSPQIKHKKKLYNAATSAHKQILKKNKLSRRKKNQIIKIPKKSSSQEEKKSSSQIFVKLFLKVCGVH